MARMGNGSSPIVYSAENVNFTVDDFRRSSKCLPREGIDNKPEL